MRGPGAVGYLPIATTIIAVAFAARLFVRYRELGGTHHLWWIVGMLVGNLLIAIGALLPGIGGTFTRFGHTEVLVTELIGLLFIYAGFYFNTAPAAAAAPVVVAASPSSANAIPAIVSGTLRICWNMTERYLAGSYVNSEALMIPSLTRFRLASALGLFGAVTSVACDREAPAPSTAEARAPGAAVAAASASGQYNPAITVYKDPT